MKVILTFDASQFPSRKLTPIMSSDVCVNAPVEV